MSILSKLGLYALGAIALLALGAFGGYRFESASFANYRAKEAQANALALQEAKNEQSKADQVAIDAAKHAVIVANQAVTDRTADLEKVAKANEALQARLNSYAKGTPEEIWRDTRIPEPVLRGLCFPTDPKATDCPGAGNPVPAHPGG